MTPVAPAGDRPRLSVVLPARSTPQRPVEQRLAHLAFDTALPAEVEFLCVDEGSEPLCAAALRAACEAAGATYLPLPPTGEAFSIARARNFGALAARGDYLLFQDLDLVPHAGFYAHLLREIELQGLTARRDEFLVVPVAYLTEAASARMLRPGRFDPQRVLDAILAGDAAVLESYAPVSSCVVLHRDYYLALGGQRADFVGWGYEDWEFAYRLMRRARRFPTPPDFDRDDYASFASEGGYRGWRAAFQLYGDTSQRRGLFLTHAHHPSEENRRGDSVREANRARFRRALAEARDGREPRVDLLGQARLLKAPGRPPLPVTLLVGASSLARSRSLHAALRNPLPIERLERAGGGLTDPLAALASAGLRLAAAVVEEPHLDRRRAELFLRLRREVPTTLLYRLGLSDCFFLESKPEHLCAGIAAGAGEAPSEASRVERYLARELLPVTAVDEGPAEGPAQLGLFVTSVASFRLEQDELCAEAALDLLAAVEARLAALPPGSLRLVIHCPRHLRRRFLGSGHEVRPLEDLDAAIAGSALCVFQHDGLLLRGLLHGRPCYAPAHSRFVAEGLARPLQILAPPSPADTFAAEATARAKRLLGFLLAERASRSVLVAEPAASTQRGSRLRPDLRLLRCPDGEVLRFSRPCPPATQRLLAQLHQAISLSLIERRPAVTAHQRHLALLLQAGGRPARLAPAGEAWDDPDAETGGKPGAGSPPPRDSRRRRLLRKLLWRPDLYLLDSRSALLRRLGRLLARG